MTYFTFSAILLTDLLISGNVLLGLFLMLLIHAVINCTAIDDVITDVCLFPFLSRNLVSLFKTKVLTLRDK